MIKKNWIIVLGLLMLVLVLVSACGGPKATTTTGAPTGTAPTTHVPGGTPTPTQTQPPTTTSGGTNLSSILGLGANISSIYYEMVTDIPGQGTTTSKVWMKDYKKFKIDMTAEGSAYIMIIDQDAGEMYMYDPNTNTAMKMTFDPNEATQGTVQNPDVLLDYNPDVTGTDTIDGKSCIVISYDIPGVGSIKEWVWTEYGFPLKMETTTSDGTTTVEFKNIDFSNIPDSEFELPDGVQIIDMSGGGIPSIPTE